MKYLLEGRNFATFATFGRRVNYSSGTTEVQTRSTSLLLSTYLHADSCPGPRTSPGESSVCVMYLFICLTSYCICEATGIATSSITRQFWSWVAGCTCSVGMVCWEPQGRHVKYSIHYVYYYRVFVGAIVFCESCFRTTKICGPVLEQL